MAAWAAAALRLGAPSLASTAETWWSTVLAEMNSFAGIAALLCPAQISSRTSRSRRVSPSGSPRVADLGPTGIDRTPRARSFCRVSRAAAERAFGPPEQTYVVGRYTIMKWHDNLLTHLGRPGR